MTSTIHDHSSVAPTSGPGEQSSTPERVLSGWQGSEAYGRVSGMSTTSNSYRGFRFPAEIINQAVWLYHCFSLSLREVELILAARDRGQLRDHPRVGPALRADLRQKPQTAPSTARRQVVSGRGVCPHPRQTALPLAGC